MNDVNSLSHTSWNCKYHIVFAPKYRRKVFYGQKRKEIGEILRTLCNWKKVKIIEAEVRPDHIHMLVEIPPKYAVSSFMGYLKGKSSLMIYEKYPELKYKYRIGRPYQRDVTRALVFQGFTRLCKTPGFAGGYLLAVRTCRPGRDGGGYGRSWEAGGSWGAAGTRSRENPRPFTSLTREIMVNAPGSTCWIRALAA